MRKLLLMFVFVGAMVFCTQAQEKTEKQDDVYENVDQMPEYPGGQDSLISFISKNVEYPAEAQENKAQGKVFVNFVVDESGNVTNARVIRSVDPDLDKEALRVINLMENWIPGKENGKVVKVKCVLPINFVLG